MSTQNESVLFQLAERYCHSLRMCAPDIQKSRLDHLKTLADESVEIDPTLHDPKNARKAASIAVAYAENGYPNQRRTKDEDKEFIRQQIA